VLQWALKLNTALPAAETWHLECHKLKVKNAYYWLLYLLYIREKKNRMRNSDTRCQKLFTTLAYRRNNTYFIT